MLLQPKNWDVFQHYKDRSPPWIKLHRDLLSNRDYMRLPTASRAIAPLLWLLASEKQDGVFDASLEELQFRLHITQKEYEDGIKPLINKGFFVVASGVLAECLQVAIPETEGEGEKEVETKREKETERAPDGAVELFPAGLDVQAWQRWVAYRKQIGKSLKPASIASAQKALAKHGRSQAEVVEQSISNGWQGLFAVKPQPAEQALSFAERDEMARRRRWEEMTGRKWPTDLNALETIEAPSMGVGLDLTN